MSITTLIRRQLEGTVNFEVRVYLDTAMSQEALANNEIRVFRESSEFYLLKDHTNSPNPISLIGSAYFDNLIL